ncbi:MAG TPA: phosphohydrolase [Candidatus Blautia intestinavium]|nr:phosphohydrolase [Candidatus Blautia intestinavium]
MSTMGTFSGRRFDPLMMTPEDVVLEDIAHALSLLCRGGGQLKYFYSVGQHCINCMKEAKARGWSQRMQLACLIHDASEAYISDIIRPVKVHLSNYMEIEERIMDKIWRRFGLDDLTEEENRRWKQVDDDVLKLELMVLIEGEENAVCEELCSCPDLSERSWRDVEEEFRDLAENLAETADGKQCG